MTTRRFTAFDVNQIPVKLKEDMKPYVDFMLFTLATRIHAALAKITPVDTGFLRLSLTASIGSEQPGFLAGEKIYNTPRFYVDQWGTATEYVQSAIARFKMGTVIEFGYTAHYAPYVEDSRHMVKTVKSAIPGMVAAVVAEARAGIDRAKADRAATVGGA